MFKFCLILALVVVVSVSGKKKGHHKVPNHYKQWKGLYDAWAACNEGFNGLTESQLAAAKRCQNKKIMAWNCYISCFRYETGMVKDGVWQDEVAEAEILSGWDEDHQEEAQKWYDDLHKCVSDFQKSGHTWSDKYTGSCKSKAIEKGKACVAKARECKPAEDEEKRIA